MNLNEFLEKLRNQPPPSGPKGLGFFILATVCAAPFVLALAFMAVARLTGKEVLSGPVAISVFMLPLLLVATVCEIILIPIAWIKGLQNYKPFLLLYIFAIFLFWFTLISTLISIGPW